MLLSCGSVGAGAGDILSFELRECGMHQEWCRCDGGKYDTDNDSNDVLGSITNSFGSGSGNFKLPGQMVQQMKLSALKRLELLLTRCSNFV